MATTTIDSCNMDQGNYIGIETLLDPWHNLQGGGQDFDEELLIFVQVIDVGVAAVAVIG